MVGDETLRPDTLETVALVGEPPVANWSRYELLGRLGEGGMGVVYRARDRHLDRVVAIKFILGPDPRLTQRLLNEARAQARIDHPSVCRVFEVGEVQGRAYIALQLVDGEPLHQAAARMSLEDKVAVMADVAAAIEEAHRRGIIHRDLKPANIMVMHSEQGWQPVVTDFGLARELTVDTGLTRSGALLGTPAYMSPEQARGDVHAVDRRSDVYGLGATLYEILTGRPPFSSTALAQALAQVLFEEPPAPRSLAALPVELETITLKCMAKDPAQRYGSARAVVDDLRRYLAGEPILGRRPSPWRRLRLRARRHRALVAVGACSIAIIAVIATIAVRAWIGSRAERARSAARTVLAEQLGRDAKELELFLRQAHQLPLHDTRPERDLVRQRMRAIAATRHDLGALGDAVVQGALGRGHLALGHWKEAAEELARAAAALPTPELHAALGRALGAQYHRALEDARRSGDAAWLARRKQELERRYLGPALDALAAGGASGDSAALLDAEIALYRREFAAAEQRAQAVAERAPWLFEARRLAGDAAYAAAVEAFDRGQYDAARLGLERAALRYAEAGEVARSDPSLHEASARAWLKRQELEFREGRSSREPLDRALESIDRALRAAPDDATAHATKADVLLRWYRTPALRAPGDQRPLFERIAEEAARAVELDPGAASAWDTLGNAHVYRGSYEAMGGGEGSVWWNRALEAFDRALAIRPDDPWATNDAGTAHRWLGAELDDTGRDPMPEYRAALRAYERATELDPQYVFAWANQADLHTVIAEHDHAHGRDPQAAVDAAQRAGERCLTVDGRFYAVLDTLAQAQLVLADHLVEGGGDPGDALARAAGYLDRADAVHPGHMVTWYFRLVAARIEAAFRVRRGADPASSIAVARAALHEALRLAPRSALAHLEAARVDLLEATRAGGARASAALARARADVEHAVALDPRSADARLVAAEVWLRIAARTPSQARVDRGIEYVDQALARYPGLAGAPALRAALLRLRTR